MPTKGKVLQNTVVLMDIINIKQPIKIYDVPSPKKNWNGPCTKQKFQCSDQSSNSKLIWISLMVLT